MPESNRKLLVHKIDTYKLLDAHCSGQNPEERYLAFDVHG